RVAYANDFDATKRRIYRALHPAGSAHLDGRPIAEVAAADIPACDLWTASFPCTDLSLAGARGGIHAGQSGAVWDLLRLLRQTPAMDGPRWVLFENVPGLLSSHGGRDLAALVSALNGAGFGVDMMRVSAIHFTPQSRPRLFLIATRLGDPAAPVRADPHALDPSDARPAAIIAAMRASPDLIWHARALPPLPAGRLTLGDIVERLPEDSPRWWPAERVEYFLAQVHPNHRPRLDTARDADAVTYVPAFRRVRAIEGVKRSVAELRFDGAAGCLRTPKGGSAIQILVRAGRGRVRVRHFTAAECMRLQGVEAEPPAGIGERDLLFALGDAVCVPAVRWVLDRLTGPAQAGAPARMASDADAPRRSAPASSMARAAS
ncbi:MAG: DNA cytosine methyltransferase, partial [Planctomycetota bacterium]